MKKLFVSVITATICFTLSSCGIGGNTNNIGNNSNLGSNIETASQLGGVLSQLLSNFTTNENSVVGTWNYSAPKIVFESENILAKIGSSVVSNGIEAKFEEYLVKMGFTKGKTKLTLNADKTCTMYLGEKEWSGTYVFNSSTKQMTITGALGVGTVTCTVCVTGNEMQLLFDANKILSIISNLSSVSPKTSSLSALLSNYSGLKLGWAMTK